MKGQGLLSFPCKHGGKRRGAGRKRQGEKAGVRHRAREEFRTHEPIQVTIKALEGLPSMRSPAAALVVLEALAAGGEREDFRIVHFSILSNHIHLIVEAEEKGALSSGMAGLMIRIAKRLNRLWMRKGRFWSDRFHSCVLKGPRRVRNSINYVIHNARGHRVVHPGELDTLSTGPLFFGVADLWSRIVEAVARPRSWLLRAGWKRGGTILP